MTSLIIRAAALAEELHIEQKRKASLVPGVPYLSHLMTVAGMVQECGGSEEAVAAAWLHDAIEDTKPEANARQRILETCGPEVLSLVLECTEQGAEGMEKAPWKERKDAYVYHLSSVSANALLISVADKLQSLRGLKQVVRDRGEAAYINLVKSAPHEERKFWTLWFNRQVAARATFRLMDFQDHALRLDFMLVGIRALLEDFDELISWLEKH